MAARTVRLTVLPLAVLTLFGMVLTLFPAQVSANSMISNSTHLNVCRQVYGKRYTSVRQLDPNSVKFTSLASTATLCNGTDPVLRVDIARRACNNRMTVPIYTVVPWWKRPFVKPQFLGWACV